MASLVRWTRPSLPFKLNPCSLCPPQARCCTCSFTVKLGRRILKKMPSRSHGTKPILSFPKNVIRFSHLGKPALKESPPFDLFLCVSHRMTTDISVYTKQANFCFLIATFTSLQQPECQHSILETLRSSSKVGVLFKRNVLSLFPIPTFSSKRVA